MRTSLQNTFRNCNGSAPHFVSIKLVRNSFCLLMLLVSPTLAQIRLYDQANDELAKKTRDAFAQLSRGDANVFETMIGNTLAIKTATLAQLYQLNRQSRLDTINKIPLLTWEELAKEVSESQQEFVTAYTAAQLILDASLNRHTPGQQPSNLKSALAMAQKRLGELKAEKSEREAQLKAEAPNLERLKDSLENLQNAVAASTKPVRKLSDLAQFKNLKEVWSNIRSAKDWLGTAEKAGNAPGLQLTILDVGAQHQQSQLERLKLRVEQADAAQRLADRIEKRLEIVWGAGTFDAKSGHATEGLFKAIYGNIVPCAPGTTCPNSFVTDGTKSQRILQTIGSLAKAANAEVDRPLNATIKLRNLLDVLGRYVAIVGYQKYLLLADAIEASVDTHLFSIRLSALNTKDREMLVAHGLDGLAAYYAGGLKPEEIANFFRAAQSIAIGVLAGRVR